MSASAVVPFTYGGHTVRTLTGEHGEILFVLADLCRVLALRNSRSVAARLDEDVKGVRLTDTLRGRRMLTTVNEAGMYEVVLRSDKPEARAFRRWVTHEVLPAIRRTGAYTTGPVEDGREVVVSRQVEPPTQTPYLPTTWDLLIATGTDTQGRRFEDEIMYRLPDGSGYASVRAHHDTPAHVVTYTTGRVERYWCAVATRDGLVEAAVHLTASPDALTRERGGMAVLEEIVRTSVAPPWREA